MRQADLRHDWIAPTPAAVAGALAAAGVRLRAADVEVLPREGRFAARLPDDRMAWFPQSRRGLSRLRRERRVLGLIAEHGGFAAPRVLHAAAEGWDLRALVAGPFEPSLVYQRVKADRGFARRLGAEMGEVLARQHAIPTAPLVGRLPRRPSWPVGVAYARRRLPRVVGDGALIARAIVAIEAYEAVEAAVSDRVLVHADFGFHNLVIDPDIGRLHGVFDYDGAALSDRLHDFKYMLLDDADETLLEGAAGAYEPAAGLSLDRGRIRLLNAASAVTFLAFRAGSAAEARPAGRTLAEDLHWTRMALERAGF
jgi:aminoglycoside phosphotransferase (APT) family kinase protein